MIAEKTKVNLNRAPRSHGFSLLEVLVALALAGILMLGLSEIFVSSVKNATATSKLSDLEDTGRIAMQILSEDVRRAGFFGGNLRLETITGTVGESAMGKTCADNTTAWVRMLSQPLFGLNDDDSDYACIPKNNTAEYLRGDVLTLRYVNSIPVDPNELGVAPYSTRLYLRTTVVEGRIFAGATQSNANNEITHVAAEVYPLIGHAYYVGESKRQCQGVNIPSLYRVAAGDNGQPVAQELLPGVEHLQFRYQVGNRYLDADDIALANWQDVTAVEIFVLVRSECPEAGFVNNRTFTMGDLGAGAYGPVDGYRRQLYRGVAARRNRAIVQ